jgi:hypothetical protein
MNLPSKTLKTYFYSSKLNDKEKVFSKDTFLASKIISLLLYANPIYTEPLAQFIFQATKDKGN